MASHGQFKWFGTMIVIYTNILFAQGLAIVMEKLFNSVYTETNRNCI